MAGAENGVKGEMLLPRTVQRKIQHIGLQLHLVTNGRLLGDDLTTSCGSLRDYLSQHDCNLLASQRAFW